MSAPLVPGNIQSKRPGFAHQKRQSLRIDMTPMVDLGFLLISFFIFTTRLTEPTTMDLNMPKEKGPEMPTKQSGALTILIKGENNLFYFEGFYDSLKIKPASYKSIRDVVIAKKHRTPEEDFFVIIKPNQDCSYKNVVDILDEMVIDGVKRYALVGEKHVGSE